MLVWLSDKSVAACKICKKKFVLLRRKHHCRACGFIVCHTCSNYTATNVSQLLGTPLTHQYGPADSVRVCLTCWLERQAAKNIQKTFRSHRADRKARPYVPLQPFITSSLIDTDKKQQHLLTKHNMVEWLKSLLEGLPSKHEAMRLQFSPATSSFFQRYREAKYHINYSQDLFKRLFIEFPDFMYHILNLFYLGRVHELEVFLFAEIFGIMIAQNFLVVSNHECKLDKVDHQSFKIQTHPIDEKNIPLSVRPYFCKKTYLPDLFVYKEKRCYIHCGNFSDSGFTDYMNGTEKDASIEFMLNALKQGINVRSANISGQQIMREAYQKNAERSIILPSPFTPSSVVTAKAHGGMFKGPGEVFAHDIVHAIVHSASIDKHRRLGDHTASSLSQYIVAYLRQHTDEDISAYTFYISDVNPFFYIFKNLKKGFGFENSLSFKAQSLKPTDKSYCLTEIVLAVCALIEQENNIGTFLGNYYTLTCLDNRSLSFAFTHSSESVQAALKKAKKGGDKFMVFSAYFLDTVSNSGQMDFRRGFAHNITRCRVYCCSGQGALLIQQYTKLRQANIHQLGQLKTLLVKASIYPVLIKLTSSVLTKAQREGLAKDTFEQNRKVGVSNDGELYWVKNAVVFVLMDKKAYLDFSKNHCFRPGSDGLEMSLLNCTI